MYPSSAVEMTLRRDSAAESGRRVVAEETAVAVVHDASTYAVMMATPQDLEDFGLGFSLTEGVISSLDEVRDITVEPAALGVEVRLWLRQDRAAAMALRRRAMAGPTGCGLCGVESLEAAAAIRSRPLHSVAPLTNQHIRSAMVALEDAQVLGRETRAVHAAGLWRADKGLVMAREDVGRHNALDKLAGGLARAGEPAAGVVVLTSRLSVEMVQKAAAMGAPVIAAVSAPTHMAIRVAEAAGITLVAVARRDSFEVFTHGDRFAR